MSTSIVFVNDNVFSYLIAKPFIECNHESIRAIILSNRTTGSLKRIFDVYEKSYLQYFTYRTLVELRSKSLPHFKKKTVTYLAKQYGIPTVCESDVNARFKAEPALFEADIAITCNFDQIIKKPLLRHFPLGVINVHASKLPNDKGISPVLWAFARGDQLIWISIYQMDAGIDSGPILKQFSVPVLESDSAYSLYQRVCERAGEELSRTIEQYSARVISPAPQAEDPNAEYWSWPDRTHREMMRQSGRKFFGYRDVVGFWR